MAQLKKQQLSSNLDRYSVLIEDTNINSSYFKLSNVPSVLHAGKNYFLIAGTASLKQNSKILVEVKDSQGNNIYSEIVDALVAGTFRLVSIYVYSDTPIGDGKIIVVGEASQYTSGVNIPVEWQGKYNVRWQKSIKVDTLMGDDTPAILVTQPKIGVTEIYDEYRTYDTVLTPVVWQEPSSSGRGAYMTAFGNKQYNSEYYLQISSSQGRSFTKDMEGGVVRFAAPFIAPFGSTVKPFNTQIVRVINENLAQVSPSYTYQYGYIITRDTPKPPVSLMIPIENSVKNEFTLSYVSKSLNVGSINKRISYLNVSVRNLDTYAGVIRYIDIFKQPGNIFLGRYPVQPNEKICKGTPFNSVGDFTNNWEFPGQNRWDVQMTADYASASYYTPNPNDWTASLFIALANNITIYSASYRDNNVHIPNTASLTIYQIGQYDLFGLGAGGSDNKIAKWTTYVYASSSFAFSGTASVDDGAAIYLSGSLVASHSGPSGPMEYNIPFISGSNKVEIYMNNGVQNFFVSLNSGSYTSQSLSTNPNVIGMNAYQIPPSVVFDNTKLLNSIFIQGRTS